MPGPVGENVGLLLTLGAAGALTHFRHDVTKDPAYVTVMRYAGYFAICGATATYVRWLFMRPPQRTPTPKEVARAVAAGAPIAPVDPRMLLSAQQMSQDLRAGKYTSAELVELFIAHIERVDRRAVNAVVWRRFDEARAEARRADEILADARAGRRDWATVGWLTGVPCSMKESFTVTGCSNCCGHPRRNPAKLKQYAAAITASGHPPSICESDAPNVARLKAAGAIILGVTNTSELAMWLESNNLVYGATCNPYDASRLVGGSSGGEAAAVAAIYAPFGNGSDIGGSIRMPSMFCGTFGHKPSTRLVPNIGMFPGTATYGNFIVGTGTMARHVEDLWPVMKTLSEGGFLEDPTLYPHCPSLAEQMEKQREYQKTLGGDDAALPLETPGDIPPATLSIYLIEELPIPFPAALPVSAEQRKAARVAAETLAANTGCALHRVDFNRPESVPAGWAQMRFALKMWAAVMRRDSVAFVDLMRGGYGDHEIRSVYWEWAKWFFARSEHTFPAVTLCVLEDLEKRFIPEKDTDADVEAGKLLARQIAETLGPRGAIIAPAFPIVAAKHHAAKLLVPSFSYTCLFNTLQLPTTSVPVWLSSDSEQQRLPCGVQVVGGWGNDVATMAVASALAKHTPYCYCKIPQWMTPVAEGAAVEVASPAKDSTIVQV